MTRNRQVLEDYPRLGQRGPMKDWSWRLPMTGITGTFSPSGSAPPPPLRTAGLFSSLYLYISYYVCIFFYYMWSISMTNLFHSVPFSPSSSFSQLVLYWATSAALSTCFWSIDESFFFRRIKNINKRIASYCVWQQVGCKQFSFDKLIKSHLLLIHVVDNI